MVREEERRPSGVKASHSHFIFLARPLQGDQPSFLVLCLIQLDWGVPGVVPVFPEEFGLETLHEEAWKDMHSSKSVPSWALGHCPPQSTCILL